MLSNVFHGSSTTWFKTSCYCRKLLIARRLKRASDSFPLTSLQRDCTKKGMRRGRGPAMIARVQERLLLLTNTYLPTTIWYSAMKCIPQEPVLTFSKYVFGRFASRNFVALVHSQSTRAGIIHSQGINYDNRLSSFRSCVLQSKFVSSVRFRLVKAM